MKKKRLSVVIVLVAVLAFAGFAAAMPGVFSNLASLGIFGPGATVSQSASDGGTSSAADEEQAAEPEDETERAADEAEADAREVAGAGGNATSAAASSSQTRRSSARVTQQTESTPTRQTATQTPTRRGSSATPTQSARNNTDVRPTPTPTPAPTPTPTPEPTPAPAPIPGPTPTPEPEPEPEPTPTPTRYRITYNLDGGQANLAGLPTSYTADSPDITVALPTATKNNYKFYRWEDAAGKQQTSITIPHGSVGDITVSAKWMSPAAVEYVKEHTPQEIADYIKAQNFDPNMSDGDTSSDIAHGNIGKVPDEVQQNAITGLNIIRYIAGVDPVRFDQGAYEQAQAGAALIAHTGNVTHNPVRSATPEVSDDLFSKASAGSGNSNIVAGEGLANVVVGSFVPDPGNIANGKSHRRYCLNPAMKTVAFGAATENGKGGRTMYVMGEGTPYNQWFTIWPAVNMPIEYFPTVNSDRTWWTVCLHRGRMVKAEKSDVRITLTYDGKTTVMTPDNDECYYNGGTIMFRPDRFMHAGDKVEVKVEGLTDAQGRAIPLEYTVNFFSLKDYDSPAQVASTEAPEQEETTPLGTLSIGQNAPVVEGEPAQELGEEQAAEATAEPESAADAELEAAEPAATEASAEGEFQPVAISEPTTEEVPAEAALADAAVVAEATA